jgi:methenyltetrahydrofolate cyclohydrolase
LARLAARTPAPGGGSAAAVTCAVAAALVEMAAGFDAAAPEAGDVGIRAAALGQRALELADLDLESYGPVLEALRMDADDPQRPPAVAGALSSAAEVPFALARIAAEVSALAAQVAERAGRHVVGDSTAAAVLSEAACRAAAVLVAINLTGATDERPTQAAECASDADVARQKALVAAHESAR